MTRVPRSLATVAVVLLLPVVAHARPGDPDPTWSGDGIAITNVGSISDLATGIVRQADGKIVVLGTSGGQYLVRYLDDGTLDPTFGTAGILFTPSPTTCSPQPQALAIDGSGRLVVAARFCNDWLVTRYDANGTLDPSFGMGGFADVPVASDHTVNAMAIQPDGKIALAGTRNVDQNVILLVRLESDGTLDAGFGTGGYLETTRTTDDQAQAIVCQPDGKLIVLALTDDGPTALRYDASGVLDPTFGTGGAVVIAVPELIRLTLQPDGRILLAGREVVAPTHAITVRLQPDGALDPSWAGTGIVLSSFGAVISDAGTGLAVQPDGKVLLFARSDIPAFKWDIGVARYLDDGSLDPTFGVGGFTRTVVGGTSLVASGGIVLAPDGRITVAATRGTTPTAFDFEVVRYLGGTCGDGIVDGGETCDDGDTLATACCSALCEAAPAGTACEEDSSLCHTDDLCDGAGTCTHAVAPMTSCASLAPGGGHFTARTSPPSLTWKWTHGDATTIGDFADPLGTDAYALCGFAGPTATPVLAAIAAGGGTCSGSPCWTLRGASAFRYHDRLRSGDGIEKIVLTAGGNGSAKVIVKAKGPNLVPPALPSALPLRIQLQSTNGGCWESAFSAAGMRVNDGARFVGRSD